MAAKANSQQSLIIQKDWENREFVEVTHFPDSQAVAACLPIVTVPLAGC
jgi:hypothetical protein